METTTDLGADQYSPPHLTLFRDENVTQITIGEQIKLALDYAILEGANLTYTQSELDALDLYMSATEALDITCMEVITTSLPYRPDVVIAIDYTEDPTVAQPIRFTPQSNLTATTISTLEEATQFTAKARYDLQIDGVVLYYYLTTTHDNGSVTYDTETDTYGNISGVNVLKQTIHQVAEEDELILHNQQFKPSAGGLIGDRWSFWANIAILSGLSYDIVGSYGPQVEDDYYDPENGTFAIAISEYNVLSDLQKEALGAIGAFDSGAGLFAWVDSQGTPRGQSFHHFGSRYYSFFGNHGKTYQVNVPDVTPDDLAEQLYNILNPLQYDGIVIRFDDLQTPDGICSILRKLNITDSSDDLTAMNALIQTCKMNYLTGRQTLKFGIADHLEPKDFIALTRQNRGRDFNLTFSKG